MLLLVRNHETKVTLLSMLVLRFLSIFLWGFAKNSCCFAVPETPLIPPVELTSQKRMGEFFKAQKKEWRGWYPTLFALVCALKPFEISLRSQVMVQHSFFLRNKGLTHTNDWFLILRSQIDSLTLYPFFKIPPRSRTCPARIPSYSLTLL